MATQHQTIEQLVDALSQLSVLDMSKLKTALEDLEKIRKADNAQAKITCLMLRAALGNAQHYLREIQDSLKN